MSLENSATCKLQSIQTKKPRSNSPKGFESNQPLSLDEGKIKNVIGNPTIVKSTKNASHKIIGFRFANDVESKISENVPPFLWASNNSPSIIKLTSIKLDFGYSIESEKILF